MAEAPLARFTRRQLSFVTREQALTVLSPAQLRHRLRIRTLEPARIGVYRLGGAQESWEQMLLAACMAAGTDARASFRAAAALWGLPGFDRDGLELTVGRRRVRLPEVIVHDTTFDGPHHRALVGPIPVTSVARTLCDLTAIESVSVIARAGDDAIRRKLVTVRAWSRVARELHGRGRRKATVTRALVDERLIAPDRGDSSPELRIAQMLERAGLPRPALQHRVRVGPRTARLDLAYPELMIGIEYDSWEFQHTRSVFDADRARGNELEVRGWCVLRFTSASSDREIVETVETALLAAGVARAS